MNCIELMVEEHKNIKRMLRVIRKYCLYILKNKEVQYEDFLRFIDFIRNYADKHHHGKEEELLFEVMVNELDSAAKKLVRHGMLVEHDLGRLYVKELETAVRDVMNNNEEAKLDIIANAIGYTNLLHRHIKKEDDVAYRYAQNNLSEKSIEKLNEKCARFEALADKSNIQRRYIDMIDEFEKKIKEN